MSPAVDPEKYREARRKTEQLAWGGILTAFSWLFLCLAFWIPTSSLFFRAAAVFALLVAEFRIGRSGAFAVYLASSALAFFYPGFLTLLPYLLYLAPYLLAAFLIAAILKSRQAVIVRLSVGCLLFLSLAAVYGESFLPAALRARLGDYYWPVLAFCGVIGSAIYDYLLAAASLLYRERLSPYFKDRR